MNAEGWLIKGSKWKDTDMMEMKAFIGCLIHAGAIHQNDISLEFILNIVDGNPLI